jgi:hypothetical protein
MAKEIAGDRLLMTPEEQPLLTDALVQLGYIRRAWRRMRDQLDRPTWEGLARTRQDADDYGAQLDAVVHDLEALARGPGAGAAGGA